MKTRQSTPIKTDIQIKAEIPFYSNYRLIAPYVAPYFAYVAVANVFSSLPSQWNYILRIIFTTIPIVWAYKWYVPLRGPHNTSISILYGIAFGLIGCVLWILLLVPFIKPVDEPWGGFAFSVRLAASTLLVPFFEELLLRVFVFRMAFQWYELRKKAESPIEEVLHNKSINNVVPGEWNYFAVVVSTLAFSIGHQMVEWPAAIIYGTSNGIFMDHQKRYHFMHCRTWYH